MDPLSVYGFGLVVATMPGHGGVTVSSPLPMRSRLLGTGVLIAFQQRQKLVPSPKQDLFHGESSTESLWFRMPDRSLALPAPCHVSIICASCFSLVLTARGGWHSFWLCCSVSAPAPRWQLLPSSPIPQLVEPEVQPPGLKADSEMVNQITEVGQAGGSWGVCSVRNWWVRSLGEDFSVPLWFHGSNNCCGFPDMCLMIPDARIKKQSTGSVSQVCRTITPPPPPPPLITTHIHTYEWVPKLRELTITFGRW